MSVHAKGKCPKLALQPKQTSPAVQEAEGKWWEIRDALKFAMAKGILQGDSKISIDCMSLQFTSVFLTHIYYETNFLANVITSVRPQNSGLIFAFSSKTKY